MRVVSNFCSSEQNCITRELNYWVPYSIKKMSPHDHTQGQQWYVKGAYNSLAGDYSFEFSFLLSWLHISKLLAEINYRKWNQEILLWSTLDISKLPIHELNFKRRNTREKSPWNVYTQFTEIMLVNAKNMSLKLINTKSIFLHLGI